MAAITLKIDLPDEVRNALLWLPAELKDKINDAAGRLGMDSLGLYIKLAAFLSMPGSLALLAPVEQDILEDLRLALDGGRQGKSGKTLDLTPHQPGSLNRVARFRQWAEGHAHDTPLLTDEEISRESLYGSNLA